MTDMADQHRPIITAKTLRRLVRGGKLQHPEISKRQLARLLGMREQKLRDLERRRENLRDRLPGGFRTAENVLG